MWLFKGSNHLQLAKLKSFENIAKKLPKNIFNFDFFLAAKRYKR